MRGLFFIALHLAWFMPIYQKYARGASSSPHTTDACKNKDIAFLLDVTGSPGDAPKIQRFLAYLVNDSFVIGPSDVNIAIISFKPEINGHVTLDKGDIFPDVSAAILTVNVHNGTSFESQTYNALDLAKTVFLSPKHVQGGRINASKIAVVLTTGLNDKFCTTVQKALAAKQQGIEVYAIGVGDKTSQLLELKAIVSPPAHTHAFHVESFDELGELAEDFFKVLCSVTNNMTSPEDDGWYRHYQTTCLNVTSFQQTTFSSPQSGATGENDTVSPTAFFPSATGTSLDNFTSSPISVVTGENDTISPTASYPSATGFPQGTAKYIDNFTSSLQSVVTGENDTLSPTASYPSATGPVLGTANNADHIKSASGIDSNKQSQDFDVIMWVTVSVIALLWLAAIIGFLCCMKKKSRRVRAEDVQVDKSAEKENG